MAKKPAAKNYVALCDVLNPSTGKYIKKGDPIPSGVPGGNIAIWLRDKKIVEKSGAANTNAEQSDRQDRGEGAETR